MNNALAAIQVGFANSQIIVILDSGYRPKDLIAARLAEHVFRATGSGDVLGLEHTMRDESKEPSGGFRTNCGFDHCGMNIASDTPI